MVMMMMMEDDRTFCQRVWTVLLFLLFLSARSGLEFV